MLAKVLKIMVIMALLPLMLAAENDSLLQKRGQLINAYRNIQAGQVNISEEAELLKQIISIDSKIIGDFDIEKQNYQITSRLQSIQQEKQIYLAQNIQLSTEIEEMKKEQLMLYIAAGFLGLLFIALFILFFVQLKKISDLAVEARDLYKINENLHGSLEKYEKNYFHMKERHEGLNDELLKLRETTAKTEKNFALIEEQLINEKRKNQVLIQKLGKQNSN